MTESSTRIGLVLDCTDPERLAEFWAPALGYVNLGLADPSVALFPDGRPGPKLLLQRVDEPQDGQEPDALRHRGRRHRSRSRPTRRAWRHPGQCRTVQRARQLLAAHGRPRRQRVLRLRRRTANSDREG